MASPSHRENLLSDKYRDIGIGVVEGDLNGVDTTIIVQFFGTRLADSIPTQPVAALESAAPSPAPSSTPSTAVASVVNPRTEARVLVSPFTTTKGISIAVVGILLLALAIDASVLSRKRIRRSGGRVFAHIAFLGMILAIILILKAGKIL